MAHELQHVVETIKLYMYQRVRYVQSEEDTYDQSEEGTHSTNQERAALPARL